MLRRLLRLDIDLIVYYRLGAYVAPELKVQISYANNLRSRNTTNVTLLITRFQFFRQTINLPHLFEYKYT